MKKANTILNTIGIIGLYIFVTTMPFSPALSEVGFEMGLVAIIVKALINKHIYLHPKVYNFTLAFFLILVGITIPFSMDPILSIKKFGIVRWLVFPYILLNLELNLKTSKRLLFLLLLVSGLFSVFVILQHLLGRTIFPYKFDVYQTVDFASKDISDRIALRFGQYYAILFVFVVVLVYFNKQLMSILLGFISTLLSIATTYFAYARSGAAGIWSSMVTFGLLKARPIFYSVVILTVIGLIFVYMCPHTEISELFYSTIHPTKKTGIRYGSNIARIHMIYNTEYILKQHPLVGTGFNCYGKWTTIHQPQDKGWERTFSDPLEFLATTGIIGFLGFIIFYIGIFYVLFKAKDAISNSVLAAFIVFASGGIFEPMFFNTVLLRAIMFLVGIALLHQQLSNQNLN